MRFFRKMHKYLLIVVVCTLLLMPIQVLGLSNGYAKIVYSVNGLQDYKLHWNDRFPPGSTLMIYAEANGVNHRRAVGVDYVFIIKDSNDNIVDTAVYENEYQNYQDNDFVKYTKIIDTSLEDGSYKAEIHIFDLLNDSIMDQYYLNVTNSLLNGEPVPDIPYMNRTNITSYESMKNTNYKLIIQNFFVDKYSNKYPANRFTIGNISLDKVSIAPGVPIQIGIDVANTFYENGSLSADIILDNKTISNITVGVGPYVQKNFVVIIPTEVTQTLGYGNHTIEIIPTSDNTIGLDLLASLNISKIEVTLPTQINYNDIQIDNLSVSPNDSVKISVTIENKGKNGSGNVGLLINNAPVEEKNVSINFSEIKDVNFTVRKPDIGEYKVTVNGSNLSKIFFVESPSPENVSGTSAVTKVEEKQIPRIFVITGLLALLILVYIVRKRVISKKISELKGARKLVERK